MKEELLRELRAMNLPKQQYKTIKGQVLSGDSEGARRGMDRIKKSKEGSGREEDLL